MSEVLKRLIKKNVTPRLNSYSEKSKREFIKSIQPLMSAGQGTGKLHENTGKEFDQLVYEIIIPSVAEAVHTYIEQNVRVVPGQNVVTNPGQPLQAGVFTGTTIAPGSGQTSTPGTLIAD